MKGRGAAASCGRRTPGARTRAEVKGKKNEEDEVEEGVGGNI